MRVIMSTVYQIDVQSADGDVKYAQAYGDLDTINYIAKKVVTAIEGAAGNIELLLAEVDAIGGQPVREVIDVIANAKVVSTVLKGELTSERKAAKTAPAEEKDDDHGALEPTTNDETYRQPLDEV
jgi:hypothetical protein